MYSNKRKGSGRVKKYKLFEQSHNIWQALQVLDEVAKTLPDEVAERSYVTAYLNGREKGFTVVTRREVVKPIEGEGVEASFERLCAHATFSEHRVSDQIVLYTGGNTNPGFGDGLSVSQRKGNLSEKDYEAAVFFPPTAQGHKDAAAAVVEFLSKQ